MSDIAPMTGPAGSLSASFERLDPVMSRHSSDVVARLPERPSDRVELSDRARLLSKLAALPDMRHDLIERVRSQIADGTYDTEEKLESALDGLAEDLQS